MNHICQHEWKFSCVLLQRHISCKCYSFSWKSTVLHFDAFLFMFSDESLASCIRQRKCLGNKSISLEIDKFIDLRIKTSILQTKIFRCLPYLYFIYCNFLVFLYVGFLLHSFPSTVLYTV